MKTAVFYHAYPSGPGVNINHGLSIVAEQLTSLDQSGLLAACDELYIGVSGGECNTCAVEMMAPEKAVVFGNAMDTCGELPTLYELQKWLPGHEGWAVFYFHTKSAQYEGNAGYAAWRKCMMNVVVWGWRDCVKDLSEGFDCVGPHWLEPRKYPGLMDFPFFGGNFWAANADYLMTLPQLSPFGPSRHEAESWVGKCPRKINVKPYANHWPGGNCMKHV